MSRPYEEHFFPPGDYMARLNTLWQAIQDADKDEGPRLATEADPGHELREEYQKLRDEARKAAQEASRLIRVAGASRREWRKLKEQHPPRTEGDPDDLKADRLAGVNLESVEDDLVYASLVLPEFTSRAAFDEWADELSAGEWATVTALVWDKTNVAQFDPKQPPPSQIRTSDATSE
jgi:hypothetical protein